MTYVRRPDMQQAPEVAAPAPGIPSEAAGFLIIGRWLVLGTVLLTLLIPHAYPVDATAVLALVGISALYNIVQIMLVRQGGIIALRPWMVIGVDLLLVTALAWFSGGVRSPFIALYSLVVVVAAAFANTHGSLAAATAATLLQVLMALTRRPVVSPALRTNYAISTMPYLFLLALVAGYLVRLLRAQWTRRQESESRLAVLDRELEIARQVQSALVGGPVPQVEGIDIAVHAEPLEGIGGDLQDYLPLADGVRVAVADISGHSLGAALLAVRLSQYMEGGAAGVALDETLAAWNDAVLVQTPGDVFVTAVLCQIRAEDGLVQYAIAGHPPPLIWRAADATVSQLSGAGMALGALQGAEYEVCKAGLAPGDVLLLYTDGAIEAGNDRGEMVEVDGLADLLALRANLPLADLVERLAEDIHAGRKVSDDLTLVAIALKP